MKTNPLFKERLAVRLNAPDSAYHGHTGAVDAHDLGAARKRDRTITLHLDDDRSTIAFADELEVLGSPWGVVPTRGILAIGRGAAATNTKPPARHLARARGRRGSYPVTHSTSTPTDSSPRQLGMVKDRVFGPKV